MEPSQNILFFTVNAASYQSLIDYIEENGFKIKIVNNLIGFLDIVQLEKIDLIICDKETQNINGFEILKLKQAFSMLRNTSAFLIINSSVKKSDIITVLDNGFDNVLFDPFVPDLVLRKIKSYLANKSSKSSLFGLDIKSYFEHSKTPILIFKKLELVFINSQAKKVFYPNSVSVLGNIGFYQLFNVKKDESNQLNFNRFFRNDLKSLELQNVSSYFSNTSYDIHLMRVEEENEVFLVELNFIKESTIIELKNEYKVEGKIGYKDSHPVNGKLTAREKEVFNLSSQGFPLKIIAERLKVSSRTVERHRSNIMKKVGASNMIEAISNLKY